MCSSCRCRYCSGVARATLKIKSSYERNSQELFVGSDCTTRHAASSFRNHACSGKSVPFTLSMFLVLRGRKSYVVQWLHLAAPNTHLGGIVVASSAVLARLICWFLWWVRRRRRRWLPERVHAVHAEGVLNLFIRFYMTPVCVGSGTRLTARITANPIIKLLGIATYIAKMVALVEKRSLVPVCKAHLSRLEQPGLTKRD
jgi:hypothetical protein